MVIIVIIMMKLKNTTNSSSNSRSSSSSSSSRSRSRSRSSSSSTTTTTTTPTPTPTATATATATPTPTPTTPTPTTTTTTTNDSNGNHTRNNMIFTCTITNISLTCCGRLDEKFQKNLNDMSQTVAPFCPPKNGWDSWLFIPPVMWQCTFWPIARLPTRIYCNSPTWNKSSFAGFHPRD